MDTYQLKFTRLQNAIFQLLTIKAGKSLNQREISRILRVSPTAIAKRIKALEKEELIIISQLPTGAELRGMSL
ncbi:MAG: winged helix-turn-helix transcriptional regulator [Nanoarchaeota archaeon]|nr:winged helix-turn-helix transcriptional regulator [Nanoarchaeota archaeon]